MSTTEASEAQPTPATQVDNAPAAATPQVTVSADPMADYEAAKAALLASPVSKAEKQTIQHDPDAIPVQTDEFGDPLPHDDEPGTTPAAPTTEEEPAPAAEPTTQVEPTEEEEEDEDEDGGKKLPQQRITARSELDDKILFLYRRNKDWTLDQAKEEAKKQLGITDEGTTPQQETEEPDNLPKTHEEFTALRKDIRKQIREAREEAAVAGTEFDLDKQGQALRKVNELEAQLDELDEAAPKIQAKQETAKAAAQAEYDRTYAADSARALDLYPEAQNKESEFWKRVVQVDATLEQEGDPLFNDPAKTTAIFRMVAREMNVAPKATAKAAPSTPAKPAAKPARPAPAPIAPGHASTSASPSFVQEIEKISTEEDYFAAKKKLLGKS